MKGILLHVLSRRSSPRSATRIATVIPTAAATARERVASETSDLPLLRCVPETSEDRHANRREHRNRHNDSNPEHQRPQVMN